MREVPVGEEEKLSSPFCRACMWNIHQSLVLNLEVGFMRVCQKCQGSMVLERAVDFQVGLAIFVYACLNCGCRVTAQKDPQPVAK